MNFTGKLTIDRIARFCYAAILTLAKFLYAAYVLLYIPMKCGKNMRQNFVVDRELTQLFSKFQHQVCKDLPIPYIC